MQVRASHLQPTNRRVPAMPMGLIDYSRAKGPKPQGKNGPCYRIMPDGAKEVVKIVRKYNGRHTTTKVKPATKQQVTLTYGQPEVKHDAAYFGFAPLNREIGA